MRAVIHRIEGYDGVGELDVAGRCLLERQLQWLRVEGVREVAVELGPSDADVRLSTWLLSDDPLVHDVRVVPSDQPLGPAEVLARSGFDLETGYVELPADALCHTPLDAVVERAQTACIRPEAPAEGSLQPARVTVRFLFGPDDPPPEPAPGWSACVNDEGSAMTLTCLLLGGTVEGPMIHAAERSPGVWVARGAHVAAGANLQPPVLIGAGAFLAAGASVGPRAVVEPRGVVERGASLVEARVTRGTLVGEGLQVRRAVASPVGMRPLYSDSDGTALGDPLVLDRRNHAARAPLAARSLAGVTAVLLALPWLLAASCVLLLGRRPIVGEQWPDGTWLRNGALGIGVLDVWPRLLDVALGRRFLLGATSPAAGFCPAAFDIGGRLAPGISPSLRRRMWAWYAHRKSRNLDWALLTGRS